MRDENYYLDHLLFVSTNGLIQTRIDLATGKKSVNQNLLELEHVMKNIRYVLGVLKNGNAVL